MSKSTRATGDPVPSTKKHQVLSALDMGWHLENRQDSWYLVGLDATPVSDRLMQELWDLDFIEPAPCLARRFGCPCCVITPDGRRWLWEIKESAIG